MEQVEMFVFLCTSEQSSLNQVSTNKNIWSELAQSFVSLVVWEIRKYNK